MYWLITYSQKGAMGNTIAANIVVKHISPADWLLAMVKKFPDANTLLLFAIEISEKQFSDLKGEI